MGGGWRGSVLKNTATRRDTLKTCEHAGAPHHCWPVFNVSRLCGGDELVYPPLFYIHYCNLATIQNRRGKAIHTCGQGEFPLAVAFSRSGRRATARAGAQPHAVSLRSGGNFTTNLGGSAYYTNWTRLDRCGLGPVRDRRRRADLARTLLLRTPAPETINFHSTPLTPGATTGGLRRGRVRAGCDSPSSVSYRAKATSAPFSRAEV
eukprot:COSAG06_NODE_6453_length_2925_cov_5.556617_3_plen_206_part_00